MKRFRVNKGRSARKFRNMTRRSKAPNVTGPMRGGWRI